MGNSKLGRWLHKGRADGNDRVVASGADTLVNVVDKLAQPKAKTVEKNDMSENGTSKAKNPPSLKEDPKVDDHIPTEIAEIQSMLKKLSSNADAAEAIGYNDIPAHCAKILERALSLQLYASSGITGIVKVRIDSFNMTMPAFFAKIKEIIIDVKK